ncbi:MAG: DUF502 domain-containing protein [Phycisphaeraceae bacterium]|nr:MAG: DUF502 domain-containing protein [Phycisphaeraceae bacterium]
MSDPTSRTSTSGFKLFFVRGLVVLLPSVLTLWLVVKAYQFVQASIAEPINQGIRLAIAEATPHVESMREKFDPTREAIDSEIARRIRETGRKPASEAEVVVALRKRNILEWWRGSWLGSMDLIGILVAILAVYTAGRLLGGIIGRRIYRRIERAITALPVFKQVYPSIKQVVDFLFGQEKQIEFKRVVVVEYPRKGIWSIGLMTGGTFRAVQERAHDEIITVFIPSSPTPFTGYTINVPRREVYDLPITIDEALRFVVSGGVLVPHHQQTSEPGEPTAASLPAGQQAPTPAPVSSTPVGGAAAPDRTT